MTIDIRHENGHYAGYLNGKLYCAGDTYTEVEHELENVEDNKGEDYEH